MDFSPPRPPYPSYPHEDPACETPYLSEGFGYGMPPLYPQTGPPPSYRPGLRMFPETRGTTVSEIIGRDLSGFPAPPGEEPPA
ncbi:NFATC4 isoform 30 [Pan troglodytes]|nr:nuclear factor of activated T-cells c4 isoform VI-IXS [Homo sapiens]KAI2570773.1 nuclear factor of activated T cells 4 [Homo sapiens]KAI4060406.1 nuclear factor of activated T cells 4 [Homo sapiens]PNI96870.1 NFATC4 isoform 30 [Pan troglodytes]PNJ35487.1 NFATC4 isoform 19 [Pongo abelii]